MVYKELYFWLKKLLKPKGFRHIPHPRRSDIRLYGLEPFTMLKGPDNLKIDLVYQVSVQSLDNKQWIPLDHSIQDSIWLNFRHANITSIQVPMPSFEDSFIILLSRYIFNKPYISDLQCKQLRSLLLRSNEDTLIERLQPVFFKASEFVLEQVKNGSIRDLKLQLINFSSY